MAKETPAEGGNRCWGPGRGGCGSLEGEFGGCIHRQMLGGMMGDP